jgi:hypothetical protein
MVLATDRDQAQIIFGYVRALITETPMLRAIVERETSAVALSTLRSLHLPLRRQCRGIQMQTERMRTANAD